MDKEEKVTTVLKILNKYIPHPKVPLHYTSSYTLLIATLLSARCTDERVNEVTPALFKLANTPEKMVKVPQKKLQSIIRICGLSPTKSKAILNLSKKLIEEYQSKVPKTFEDLESLPGVGHKTASVVMAHAFHIPAFPVDTHIQRVAKRWGLTTGRSVKKIEEDLKELIPKSKWIKAHMQMILFGRKYCKARGHVKSNCPMCSALG